MLILHILSIICKYSHEGRPKDIGNFFEAIGDISDTAVIDSESGTTTIQGNPSAKELLKAIEAVSMEETSDDGKNNVNFLKALINSEYGNGNRNRKDNKNGNKKNNPDDQVYKKNSGKLNSTSEEDSGASNKENLESKTKEKNTKNEKVKSKKATNSQEFEDEIEFERSSELLYNIKAIAKKNKLDDATKVRQAHDRAAKKARARAEREEMTRNEIDEEAKAAREKEEYIRTNLDKAEKNRKRSHKESLKRQRIQKSDDDDYN
ncbi:hypothetical protein GINT2_002018 [Glugoides intestinalis]